LAELFVPGFGVPGIIGLVSLSLYFLGGILAGLAGSAEIILFVAGLVLIAVELLIAPGFGVPGILGLAAILGSVYLTFEEQALVVMGISLLLVVVGMTLFFIYLPRGRVVRPLVNQDMLLGAGVGEYRDLLGAVGQSLTDLRPAGLAQFGERRVDVVSQGQFIPKGTSVRIITIEGNRVVVESLGG
jgi:membrane-bound serine protease (ClpP class)